MPSPNSNNLFLSQRVEQHHGSPPVLLPKRNGTNASNKQNTEVALVPDKYQNEDKNKTDIWGMTIEVSLIPSLPMYYMLEPASITLREVPVSVVGSRLTDFLRIHSISCTYHPEMVRFECATSTLLKFVIQLWRVNETDELGRAVTLELQRRQGSVVEMQTVRRKLFHAVLTGEQAKIPYNMTRSPMQAPTIPDTIMAEVDAESGYDHDAGRTEALQICLRLLESNCIDQTRLGLESLSMLTDPSIVSRQDALAVSRAIILREGEVGARLQARLGRNSFGFASSVAGGTSMTEYHQGFHQIGLAILANSLQILEHDTNYTAQNDENSTLVDLTDNFWGVVSEDLSYNVERAVQYPNEGAVSAKCIRLLKRLTDASSAGTTIGGSHSLRGCLSQALHYGRCHHFQLEQESRLLLAMDMDVH